MDPQQTEKEGGETQKVAHPQKKFYRQRAHANPLSTHVMVYPVSPSDYAWRQLYPAFAAQDPDSDVGNGLTRDVEVADIGCGYGGLLIALGEVYPEMLMVGMEIRTRVSAYVYDRIHALRVNEDKAHNLSVIRTNTMKYLPNFFSKGQLSKIFFLFPDPHFKTKNHRRRIITPTLLAEYAYALREGGKLYHVTDVKELFDWCCKHLDAHPLFRRIPEDTYSDDPAVRCAMEETEEGKKVARNGGDKWAVVYERIVA